MTRGRCSAGIALTASATARVAATLERLISTLCAAVHRVAIGSPAVSTRHGVPGRPSEQMLALLHELEKTDHHRDAACQLAAPWYLTSYVGSGIGIRFAHRELVRRGVSPPNSAMMTVE